MSEEDRRYLRNIKKMGISQEVFEKLVEILKGVQNKTDDLLKTTLLAKV